MSTYTVIGTTSLGKLAARQAPVPDPKGNHIVIKVEYGALTPFDVYVVDRGFYANHPQGIGGNVSGTVAKVGPEVTDLKVGDRVAGFSYGHRGRAIQEYVELPRSLVGKLPDDMPLDQGNTVVDNFVTAFYTLYSKLELPLPSSFPSETAPANPRRPLLIYGAGTTCGQYAIQLLALQGYKNIIAVASKRHEDLLKSFGATAVVDYNSPNFVEEVTSAVKQGGETTGQVDAVVDCVTLTESVEKIGKVIRPDGQLAFLAPLKHGGTLAGVGGELHMDFPPDVMALLPAGVKVICVRTFQFQSDSRLTDTLVPKIMPDLLERKVIRPARFRTLDTGTLLERAEQGIELFRKNQISGEKLLIKISD